MAKRPTTAEITEVVVASGATAQQGADSAVLLTGLLQGSADSNDFLAEFNNAIEQRYNDVADNATIYDEFKK